MQFAAVEMLRNAAQYSLLSTALLALLINIRYCVYYLRRLYDRYGDWLTACAAYNAGSGRVDAWLDDPTMVDLMGNLIESRIPFEETRAYVRKIKKAYTAYERLSPTGDVLPFL